MNLEDTFLKILDEEINNNNELLNILSELKTFHKSLKAQNATSITIFEGIYRRKINNYIVRIRNICIIPDTYIQYTYDKINKILADCLRIVDTTNVISVVDDKKPPTLIEIQRQKYRKFLEEIRKLNQKIKQQSASASPHYIHDQEIRYLIMNGIRESIDLYTTYNSLINNQD